MLAAMISGTGFNMQPGTDGSYFIDNWVENAGQRCNARGNVTLDSCRHSAKQTHQRGRLGSL
jgi:hypothetical protein